jgi:hypothetical protein
MSTATLDAIEDIDITDELLFPSEESIPVADADFAAYNCDPSAARMLVTTACGPLGTRRWGVCGC